MRGSIRGKLGRETYWLDGVEVSREEFDRAFPDQSLEGELIGHQPGCWPQRSEALAVHPDQVDEANERNRRHGVGVTYDRTTGQAIIPDRAERKRLLRLEKYHDNNGGYGD